MVETPFPASPIVIDLFSFPLLKSAILISVYSNHTERLGMTNPAAHPTCTSNPAASQHPLSFHSWLLWQKSLVSFFFLIAFFCVYFYIPRVSSPHLPSYPPPSIHSSSVRKGAGLTWESTKMIISLSFWGRTKPPPPPASRLGQASLHGKFLVYFLL